MIPNLINRKFAVVAALVALVNGQAWAQQGLDAEKAERCATRLSVSFLGKSPSSALMSQANPQSEVDAFLSSADFVERFSRFVNATFNNEPGALPEQDPAYYLAKHVLTNNRPWEEMFLGQYNVDKGANDQVVVTADPNGLGYFRSEPWLKRYAGNELAGIKLSTAYRIMNNTIGLKLVASTSLPGADTSANGRQAAGCRSCHYDGWFALDKVANVLTRRVGEGDNVTFAPSEAGPQDILGGITISDDKELVTALVRSEAFRFRSCRLAFEFLYGRPESACEAPVFDACMTEFSAKGTIQSALAVVAKHQAYCQ